MEWSISHALISCIKRFAPLNLCENEEGKRVRPSVTERVPEKEGNMLGPHNELGAEIFM